MTARFFALLCTLLHLSLFASNELHLSQQNGNDSMTGYMSFVLDKDNSMTLGKVSTANFEPLKNANFGPIKGSVWTKLTIVNDTNKSQKFVLMNLLASMDEIDVWIGEDGSVREHLQLGDKRAIDLRPVKHRCSVAPVEIEPSKSLTIISRNANPDGTVMVDWHFKNWSDFFYFSIKDMLFWGLFAGTSIALIIYNLSLFTALRSRFYIYYSLLVLTLLMYQLGANGVFYFLEAWFEFGSSYIYGLLSGMFMLLFSVSFFELAKSHKRFTYFIYCIVCVNMVIILLTLSPLSSLLPLVKYAQLSGLLTIFTTFAIAILAVYKRLDSASYFLIGQTALVVGHGWQIIVRLMSLGASVEKQTYILAICSFVDMLFLSIAISQKIKNIELENKEMLKLLAVQNRFASIGKTASNIAHQWRQPISHMGTLVTLFDTLIRQGKDETAQRLAPLMPKLQSDMDFVVKTMDEMGEFYKSDSTPSNFSVKREIEQIVELLSGKMNITGAKVIYEPCEEFEVINHKNAFANIIMILIDNSIDMLKENKIQNPRVGIKVEQSNDSAKISISDNAGGIAQKPIESIFDPFISSKEDGSGLGLSIAKMLVVQKLGGDIEVFNGKDGACFCIMFQKNLKE